MIAESIKRKLEATEMDAMRRAAGISRLNRVKDKEKNNGYELQGQGRGKEQPTWHDLARRALKENDDPKESHELGRVGHQGNGRKEEETRAEGIRKSTSETDPKEEDWRNERNKS